MAVIDIREKRTGRGGSVERNWVRTYTRTFQLITNDPFDSTVTIRASLPVNLGDSYQAFDLSALHEHDTGSFCSRININCVSEDGLQWEAVCDYSPFDANQFPQNPLDWPLRISWSNATYQIATHEDVNGDPIRNAAGDFFDPPVTIDDNRPVLRIVRNEASYDPALAGQFSDAVNEGVFFGQDPKTWKCKPITAELEFNRDCGTADGYYYVVTYEFEFNPDTWVLNILEQGLRQLDLAGDLIPITEKGLPITTPVPLAEDGFKLASGLEPVFVEKEVYPVVDFSVLNIDPDGAPGQG